MAIDKGQLEMMSLSDVSSTSQAQSDSENFQIGTGTGTIRKET